MSGTHRSAERHLRSVDPVLASVMRRVGSCGLVPQRGRFQMLARSIISQQISTAAARSIRARLMETLKPNRLTADNVAALSIDELRGAGLSGQKANYLHALAAGVADRTLRLDLVHRWDDEKVIEHLTNVKGIGHWTAQMFLMFALGRPDVFPHDDLGIRSALRRLYGLKELPDRRTSLEIAAPWRPYASAASWYCWRSLDLAKKTGGQLA